MHGIIQRPAPSDARVQRVGDILELRWRPRLSTHQKATVRRRTRQRQRSDARNLVDALVLVVTVAILAGFAYLHVRQGTVGL
jgi:IS5 family transposase